MGFIIDKQCRTTLLILLVTREPDQYRRCGIDTRIFIRKCRWIILLYLFYSPIARSRGSVTAVESIIRTHHFVHNRVQLIGYENEISAISTVLKRCVLFVFTLECTCFNQRCISRHRSNCTTVIKQDMPEEDAVAAALLRTIFKIVLFSRWIYNEFILFKSSTRARGESICK